MLRVKSGHVLMILEFEVKGQWTTWRLRRMWKRQVMEEEIINIGLGREDVLCLSKRMASIDWIFTRLRLIRSPSVVIDIPELKH